MNYTIQSGDNLWNIAKTKYNLTSNSDIQNKVNEIAKTNNIANANQINANDNLVLRSLNGNDTNDSSIKQFDDWSNSTNANLNFEYANSANSEEEIAKKAQEFSEAYINAKGNNDGNIDLTEFMNNNKELS